MPFLLDTNIAIHVRDADEAIVRRVGALDGAVLLSVVTRVELEGGVHREPGRAAARQARLDAMLEILPVIAFDDASADAHRAIVQARGYSRRKLLDRMIAAQALVHQATLVTLNAQDFQDVPGLDLLAWQR